MIEKKDKIDFNLIQYQRDEDSFWQRSKKRRRKKRIKRLSVIICFLTVFSGAAFLGNKVGLMKNIVKKSQEERFNVGVTDLNRADAADKFKKVEIKGSGENDIPQQKDSVGEGETFKENNVQAANTSRASKQKGEKFSSDTLKKVNLKNYAVPKSKAVSAKYFADAAFIGDSRTEGLQINTGLKSNFYAKKGLSIDSILKVKAFRDRKTGSKITLQESLAKHKYKKIYIMFGVNELGWPYDKVFYDRYYTLVKTVKKLQPNAVIYVQGIIPVTKEKAKDSIYKNSKVARFNKLIALMTKKLKVNFLNVAEAVQNKNGELPKGSAIDGVHLNKQYCLKWIDYLKKHTVKS